MGETINTTSEFREHWLNPRRKRLWVIALVLLYTLFGFFLAPVLIKSKVVNLFQEDLGRSVTIEKINVNPYVLSLEVQGFEVLDKDKIKLAAFDAVFINFQLSSLFKWAWVFKEVKLDAPYVYLERFKSGESRQQHLLTDIEAAFPANPDEVVDETTATAPRLMIQNLSVHNGQIDTRDNLPDSSVVELEWSPVTISVQKFSTLPDIFGEQKVEIVLPNEGLLSWSGSLKLLPLYSEGQLTLKNLKFDRSIAYLKSMLPLEALEGQVSSQFEYRLSLDDKAGLSLQIDRLQVQLDHVQISGLTPSAEFVNIPQINLSDGQLRYPERNLKFAQLQILRPALSAWRNADESISFMDLAPAGTEPVPANDVVTPGWALTIAEVSVEGGNIALADNSVEPATAVTLSDFAAKATQISTADGAIMPFELTGNLQQGGSYQINGDLTVLPEVSMTATATITQIPLVLAQAYSKPFARIEIKGGVFDSKLKIALPDSDSPAVTGNLKVSALEINDSFENQKLLAWKLLDIDQFEFTGDKIRFSQMDFSEPFAQLVINQDRSTNVAAILASQSPVVTQESQSEAASQSISASQPAAATQPAKASDQALVVIIGGIKVANGSMNFADLSLPLPFSTHITALNGAISTIATDSVAPADIKLEGQVDAYGLARIDGKINIFDPVKLLDVSLDFRNLEMAALSPYTVEFAGREIDKGKLGLGLVYNIKDGQLDAANDIVLSDLVLGKKVDYPGAANLPLGLAVALLKDSDGVIKVDLPIKGDINDPEFRMGGLVWKAITNLITRIVTAPFKLLGSLIGIDSEELGQFEFLAGRADLTPPELEKVAQLQKALQERPQLAIEIAGVTDSEIDTMALKKIRLLQTLNDRLGEGLVADEGQNTMMLDERIRNMVENMFKGRFPEVFTDPLKEAHKAPPVDDPEGELKLDELAYVTDLWNQMLAAEPVSEQDLTDLADARAGAIKDTFLASGEFDAQRVIITTPKQVTSEDGEWIVLELGVTSD